MNTIHNYTEADAKERKGLKRSKKLSEKAWHRAKKLEEIGPTPRPVKAKNAKAKKRGYQRAAVLIDAADGQADAKVAAAVDKAVAARRLAVESEIKRLENDAALDDDDVEYLIARAKYAGANARRARARAALLELELMRI